MEKTASNNEITLRSAPFGRLAAKLCVPAILVMLVTVIYNMADIFFIGQTGDPNQVAAVSLAAPVFTILSGLGVLLGSGGCTAVSLALGRNERDKIKRISAFCIYGSLALGVAFGVLTLVFLPSICQVLGAENSTLSLTQDYLRVLAIGAPVIMFNNVVPSLIRADGSTFNSMIGNLIGTVINMVLDPILILMLKWTVTGAAMATVLGNVGGMIYYECFIHGKGKIYQTSIKMFGFHKDVVIPVLSLGLPMSISTILQSISSAIANNRMMAYGAVAVSAQSVASRIGMLITMTVMGICIGMQPAISFNYSAKNRSRLTELIWKTTALSLIVGTVLSALSILFRDPLLTAFINDEEVLKIGRVCLLVSVVIGPVYGFYQISTTYLQSTGKARPAIVISMLEKGLVYVPVLFLFQALFGMNGIIFSGTFTTVVSMIVSLIYCFRTFRKELAHEQKQEQPLAGDR